MVIVKKFTARYLCRNEDLNLILVAATTNGFLFQIVDSLMASIGVRLTWRDCSGELSTQKGSRKKRTANRICVTNVTGLLLACFVAIFT